MKIQQDYVFTVEFDAEGWYAPGVAMDALDGIAIVEEYRDPIKCRVKVTVESEHLLPDVRNALEEVSAQCRAVEAISDEKGVALHVTRGVVFGDIGDDVVRLGRVRDLGDVRDNLDDALADLEADREPEMRPCGCGDGTGCGRCGGTAEVPL